MAWVTAWVEISSTTKSRFVVPTRATERAQCEDCDRRLDTRHAAKHPFNCECMRLYVQSNTATTAGRAPMGRTDELSHAGCRNSAVSTERKHT